MALTAKEVNKIVEDSCENAFEVIAEKLNINKSLAKKLFANNILNSVYKRLFLRKR